MRNSIFAAALAAAASAHAQDGVLTATDFSCFQTRFALGNAYADCNGDGVLGLADFSCFQTKFVVGCP